ncbi:MAG: preprotein translocase subunit SecG [Clostridia bacterium]|nr:preprotein translocase subunit SecG [Clostridia bacterium]
MFNFLATTFDWKWVVKSSVDYICVIGSVILALFIIIVVLIQPGNSNGISALGGNAETFYNKGKGKTIESKLKILTFVSLGLMAIFMLAFFIIQIWDI